jgi:hypothetical protein
MSDIVTILTELLMKAQEELASAITLTSIDVAQTKVKQLEMKLDRILCTADL